MHTRDKAPEFGRATDAAGPGLFGDPRAGSELYFGLAPYLPHASVAENASRPKDNTKEANGSMDDGNKNSPKKW